MQRVVAFFVLISLPFTALPQAAKPSDKMLAFEVASVKLADPGARLHMIACYDPTSSNDSVGAGRCSIHGAPLNPIILYAYGLTGQSNYIRGGPAWMGTEEYSFEAKAENPMTTTADLKRMLQGLLADRFKLRIHIVTEDATGYSIVVGRNGSKLQPGDPSASRGDVSSSTSGAPPMATITAKNTTLDNLARALSRRLSAQVENRTNLQGTYAISLSWAANDDGPGPSLSTALQEQLGLTLQSAKISQTTIVVDQAEKPNPNQ